MGTGAIVTAPALTLDAIVTGASVGSLMSTIARWARSGGKLRAHKCDADNPTIWRRMWGCNGDGTVPSTNLARRGHEFIRVASWRCGSCAAMEAASRVRHPDEYQHLLCELQD